MFSWHLIHFEQDPVDLEPFKEKQWLESIVEGFYKSDQWRAPSSLWGFIRITQAVSLSEIQIFLQLSPLSRFHSHQSLLQLISSLPPSSQPSATLIPKFPLCIRAIHIAKWRLSQDQPYPLPARLVQLLYAMCACLPTPTLR